MKKYHMQKSEREIRDRGIFDKVLSSGKFLTLALCRHNEPYIITLNYGYDAVENSVYFHTATKGLKLQFVAENPSACATIIEDHGYIEEVCSHAYRSIVFTGKIEILHNIDEKKAGLETMLIHLEKEPDIIRQRLLARNETYDNVTIMRMRIEDITGKEGNIS
jgi:nitroimidazol reductase NimA-like FMN-containing flavoprotein (pyridoxamine 5'-phosphate oxidase superfamily)